MLPLGHTTYLLRSCHHCGICVRDGCLQPGTCVTPLSLGSLASSVQADEASFCRADRLRYICMDSMTAVAPVEAYGMLCDQPPVTA